jgi:endonuclease/exonuclease/phosphatase family metal-dependent hydrolase
MTYNIRYGTAPDGKNSWKFRRPLVARLISQQNPDIVGTQEALRFQLDDLCGDLGCYEKIGVGRTDGKCEGEYAAILYKRDHFSIQNYGTFWFSDTPEVAGSCHWGNSQPRICTWAFFKRKTDESMFAVYNVHLDHHSYRSRQKSIELLNLILSTHTDTLPVIITGDFNVIEQNRIIRQIKGKKRNVDSSSTGSRCFTDAYRQMNRFSCAGTFNLFTGFRFGPRIDYIFTEQVLRVHECSIIRTNFNGRYPSDHFPVTAKIGLPVRPC